MLAYELVNEMDRLQEEMNRLFQRPQVEGRTRSFPAFNLWASEDQVVATAELPGVNPDDIDISVKGDVLTVSGSRPEPELRTGEQWVRQERPFGPFSRMIRLPYRAPTQKVSARYKNGVLTIALPRAEEEKPRKIDVRAS